MRPIATATTAILLLALAGCSSSPSEADKAYASAVKDADPDFFGAIPVDDLADTLDSQGPDICTQLKRGEYADAIAYVKLGFKQREAEALVTQAVPIYCPDQASKLP